MRKKRSCYRLDKYSRIRNDSGYIAIKIPDHPFANQGFVLEHRLVMEKKLKRFLKPSEIVHHINGKRDDNRIENLRVYENITQHFNAHNNIFDEDSYWMSYLEDIFGVNEIIDGPDMRIGYQRYGRNIS